MEKKLNIEIKQIDNTKIILKSNYNSELLQKIKTTFKTREWDSIRKEWTLMIEEETKVENIFNFLSEEQKKLLIKIKEEIKKEKEEKIKKSFATDSEITIPLPSGLSLFDFQKAGVEWIIKHKNVLIGDEMGLGKTVQAITFLNTEYAKFPVFIICPASVKYNWAKELKKWLTKERKIQIVEGKKDEIDVKNEIFILNYDIVSEYTEKITKIETLILDECHYIKNYQAKRTKAVKDIAKKANKIIALSGTPFLNRPSEIFTTLNILDPQKFSNFFYFAKRYCAAKETKYGWDFSGASNINELAEILRSTVMIRREKKQVLSEMQGKIRTIVPVKIQKISLEDEVKNIINNIEEKKKIITDLKEKLKNTEKEEEKKKIKEEIDKLKAENREIFKVSFSKIEEYRKEAAEKKIDYIIEFIENILEQNHEKLILFCHHRDIAERLYKIFEEKSVLVTGEIDSKQRQESVEKFQNDEKIKIFIGTIRACGEGITLTAAGKVIFVEYDWTPARMIQAEDRAHRIGQKNIVNIYWFSAENTIDSMFIEKIVSKMNIFNQAMMTEDEFEIFE